MIATAVKYPMYASRKESVYIPKTAPVLDAVSDAILAEMAKTAPVDGPRDYILDDEDYLTEEEIADADECLREYKEHPETFVPLEEVMRSCKAKGESIC